MSKTIKNEDTYYAYLNINHPMVAWEAAIGRIKSIFEISNKYNISLWQYSLLSHYAKHGESNRLLNELLLEQHRLKDFPDKVSRLHGLYFFENEYDAENALSRWGIKLNKKYISPIKFFPEKLTKVDSEWITTYMKSNKQDTWMNDYWNGKTYGYKPLTEILALGLGIILNYDLRIEAYKRIMNLWPYSTPVLAIACCAFQAKSIDNVALVKPVLFIDNQKLKGSFSIDISDLDLNQKDIIEAVKICKSNGSFPPIKNMEEKPGVYFQLPDLREYDFEFNDTITKNNFTKIHHY